MSQTDTAETTANRTDGQEVSTTAGETVEETRSEWTDYEAGGGETKLAVEDLDVHYGDDHALKGVSIDIPEESVTALIGPSGCGKSTFLRCLNRMNDRIRAANVDGMVELDGEDIYQDGVDLVELRKRVGMVFQSPNPFPKSIRENVSYGPRKHGDIQTGLLARLTGRAEPDREEALVERSLERAALWGGEQPAGRQRARTVRRSTTATLYRSLFGRRPGGHPHGRAGLGARSDRHLEDRGSHRRSRAGLHRRRRHS